MRAACVEVNPGSYIADILPRISTWPHRRLDELLPHAWAAADDPAAQSPSTAQIVVSTLQQSHQVSPIAPRCRVPSAGYLRRG
jgi:hypothetical protein